MVALCAPLVLQGCWAQDDLSWAGLEGQAFAARLAGIGSFLSGWESWCGSGIVTAFHLELLPQRMRDLASPGPTVISSLLLSFSKRGFSVRSFGTGTHVKLPGPAPDKPNVYDFKTTYDQMYNDLLRKDKELYTQNGILHMLDRNKRIKPRPERFQNCKDLFDLILTCEERVYDQVVEDLNSREQETCQPVHVVNVDIQDNHEEATLGAFLICELCQCIQHTEDMENEIDELLQEFEEKSGRTFLHTVCFY
ncbi:RNA polymerase II subunit A C-terminal domain phosphatase SSU72-like [Carlito syrichta]|uniref:RNA polymerase II subunit A C-terminal domain phosphatase SSU72 n=3 Tax=Haplorrhini TaxID=376913 RepID=A0A3Q0DVH1_CARSF|nr:RNA polymerase II subunit A C-terminal domain phosphatase SSU72-like [Carlito syrichta]